MRLLATVWVDLFRGVPTILLVYLIGFGIPALELEGLPTDPVVLGGIALTLSYSGYVAEVYRAGINSVHPARPTRPLSRRPDPAAGDAPRGPAAGDPPRRRRRC